MTNKERLLAAASGQSVDRPPCICPGGMKNMVCVDAMDASGYYWPEAHSDAEQMAKLAMALGGGRGFENYGVPFDMTVEAEALGAVVYIGDKLTEPHVVESPMTDISQWATLPHIDFNKGRIKATIDAIKIIKSKADDYPIIGNLTGPFSVAGTMIEMAILLKEIRRHPDDVHGLMRHISGELAEFGQRMVDAGADLICLSEPSGTGEILGMRWFKDFSVQYINMVLDKIEGTRKIVHICGNMAPVYEALPDLHCDVFSFESKIAVSSIKPYLEGKAVMGNVSTHAIGTAPPERVERLSNNAIKTGIDILAPACGIPSTTPLENVQAMVMAAKGVSRSRDYNM
ncbi:MAG: methylcobamide--CoM methyltransferase [Oscillospiraceae bacterium]|nr:methylcobamide--CoM methyltransferase [Oscillospiraceae bacterium]